ncbi:hypothetical protein DFQ28_009968 [Apophysomyces sp. BC1034]|nr:hypothetical protein DFQ28_009968 [Apophysomyces sp. BC1034]
MHLLRRRPLPHYLRCHITRASTALLSYRRIGTRPTAGDTLRPGFFTPFFSSSDEVSHHTYARKTAKDMATSSSIPTRAKMLVRDFIDNSLHNPHYGSLSKKAVDPSVREHFDFMEMYDQLDFLRQLERVYKGAAQRIWHTPTELFKPWYGYAIAKYMVAEYKLNLYPHKDLIIYEIGAGNGTLMLNILNYIQTYEPSVFKRTQYNIIEISESLAKQQGEKLVNGQHDCVQIINQSIFEWDAYDTFAHDLIRYDMETLQPYQGLVSVDSSGNCREMYEQVGGDALIHKYLSTRKQTHYRSPVLSSRLWNRLLRSLQMGPKLTRPEYIPTKLFQLLGTLKDHFPNHRLVLSAFSTLPDTIDGVDAPVVQTRYKNRIVPCSTYMVQPGWFEALFPTNFELLREMYLLSCRITTAGNNRNVKVLTHREFCERYGEVEFTTTRSGDNPMLTFHENMKMLIT